MDTRPEISANGAVPVDSGNAEMPSRQPSAPDFKGTALAPPPFKPIGDQVGIYKSSDFIYLKLNKDETDIAFIRTLKHHRWDHSLYHWIITNSKQNSALVEKYFNIRLIPMAIPQLIAFEEPKRKIKKKASTLYMIEYTEGRVRLDFEYNERLIAFIGTIAFHKWDNINKWWSIPYKPSTHAGIEKICKEIGWEIEIIKQKETELKAVRIGKGEVANYKAAPDEMVDMLKRMRYSEHTIKNYASAFEEFINYYHAKDIKDLGATEVKGFIMYLVNERKVSVSYQNIVINAIKFYLEKVCGAERQYFPIERPRVEKKLPKVIGKNDIWQMINKTTNLKHKCMIMLLYSSGLRRSELLNLIPSDIDSENMRVLVRDGKGKKDRYTLLAKSALDCLREYYKMYRPQRYMFEGENGGQYSAESLVKVVKLAASKAGVKRPVAPHILRHSFATHLLEDGVDTRYIQSLMGHYSTKTTEIYTHITQKGIEKIKSPLDNL